MQHIKQNYVMPGKKVDLLPKLLFEYQMEIVHHRESSLSLNSFLKQALLNVKYQ